MSPTRPDRIDVAVIGGGVAGAVCAAILARAGARVALVHGVEARRSTVELLSGRARWLLRNLDLPAGEGVEINRTISHWGGALPQTREAMFDPYGPGLAVERASLDLRLREAATSHGASVLAARARALSRASGAWQIGSDKATLSAANVVLATGAIRSPLIPRDSRTVVDQIAFLARGLRRSVSRPKSVAAGNVALNVDDTLRVEATDIGWWYALPAPDGTAFVGVCTRERPRAADRVAWFRRALRQTRLISTFVDATSDVWGAAAPVRTYPRAAGPNWIAVGNAAFSPDPLCGEGLWFAVRTARAAAAVLMGSQSAADYQEWIAEATIAHQTERERRVSVLAPATDEASWQGRALPPYYRAGVKAELSGC
jgi:flavin-dependent dehydrogenase